MLRNLFPWLFDLISKQFVKENTLDSLNRLHVLPLNWLTGMVLFVELVSVCFFVLCGKDMFILAPGVSVSTEFLLYLAPQIECQVCLHCRLFIWASIEVSFNWQWNSLVTFQYTFITLLNFKKNELKKIKIRISTLFHQKISDTVGKGILLFPKSFKVRLEWLYCVLLLYSSWGYDKR